MGEPSRRGRPTQPSAMLRLGGRLLLLLLLLRPGWYDSVHARVGDGLAKVFARVSGDHDKRATVGRLLTEQLERLVEVRIAKRKNSLAEVGKGVLQGLNGFWFISGIGHDGFRINARGGRSAESSSETIVCRGNVVVDLPDGTNPFARAPSVLLGGHGLGQARESLLIEGDLCQEIGAGAGRRFGNCCCRRGIGAGVSLGLSLVRRARAEA